ncbi:hypothetical protein NQ318_018900 [Aromia moschata]|uniref:Uncharacterized protein n=1 Tax=Aromia moschata TaxID=1265417 RepID=A0AAV8ZHQ6_9CUCU|nr:hypothetical protein NQ318_018900 [Aromia moschata]
MFAVPLTDLKVYQGTESNKKEHSDNLLSAYLSAHDPSLAMLCLPSPRGRGEHALFAGVNHRAFTAGAL